jgi:membrane protein insertase Oxa1/YidC/SpoIIIJ
MSLYPSLSAGGDITERFNEILYQPLKFASGEIVNTKFLYFWDVAKPDVIKLSFLPFNLPGPIILLAALVQFASSKLMSPVISQEKKIAKKTEGSQDDMQVAMQQSMTYTFPLMTVLVGMGFPSGLVIYWFLFSFWQLMQQLGTSDKEHIKPCIIG